MKFSGNPADLYHQYNVIPNWTDSTYRELSDTGVYSSILACGTWRLLGDQSNNYESQKIFENLLLNGTNHFDCGNNYGRPPGSAEKSLGDLIRKYDSLRNELIITTKAGYEMRPGPNGSGSSYKHLRSELEESLKRLRLDYVDIFYTHRYDPRINIEVVANSLLRLYELGYFLYAGISSYPKDQLIELIKKLRERNVPIATIQYNISMINLDWFETCQLIYQEYGITTSAFGTLGQGVITESFMTDMKDKGSRFNEQNSPLYEHSGDSKLFLQSIKRNENYPKNKQIEEIGLAWLCSHRFINSCIYGPRTVNQVVNNAMIWESIENSLVFYKWLDELTFNYSHNNKLDRWKTRDPKKIFNII